MTVQHPPRVVAGPAAITGAIEPIPGLTLGHVLAGIGAENYPPIPLKDVLVIRWAFRQGDPGALRGPEDLTEERVLAYTREQDISPRRFPADPPRYWVVLVADGQRRSRLYGTYQNHGEVVAERPTRPTSSTCARAASLHP